MDVRPSSDSAGVPAFCFRAAPRRLSGAMHFVPHLFIDASGGPARLLTCTGQVAKPFGFRTAAPFLSAPPSSEPYSRLNRTTCGASQIVRFSTSRQSTPRCARESGTFFVIRWRGLGVLSRSGGIIGFQSRIHIPTLPPAFFRYKERYSDFPDQ